jgi:ubiquinone/menaquinone biosynthesis C-methylase UbiE
MALQMLPVEAYVGVNHNDPIRFYRWPIIGPLYRRRVEATLAELRGGDAVLEIGFGSGVTFLELHRRYRHVHGLDLTADVGAVGKVFADRGVDVTLVNGSVLDLPYPSGSFDSVLLISILEHLKPQEQPRAFGELRRVLKPGGQVVYGVPVERPLMVLAFRLLGYDIREHHFSTEHQVAAAAGEVLRCVRRRQLKAAGGLLGSVYEIGHFVSDGR